MKVKIELDEIPDGLASLILANEPFTLQIGEVKIPDLILQSQSVNVDKYNEAPRLVVIQLENYFKTK